MQHGADEENFIRDIARSMPGGLYQFIRRPNGAYALPYISDRFAEIMGVTAADVRDDATAAFARVNRDDLPGLLQSIEHSAATLEVWMADFRICRPDGSELWLRGQSTPRTLDGGTLLWNGVLLDVTVTKRVAAAEALREREQSLRLALIASRAGFYVLDLVSGRGEWDDRTFAVYGQQKDAFDPSLANVTGLVLPEDRAMLTRFGALLQSTGTDWHDVYRVKAADGGIRAIEGFGYVMRAPDNTPLKVIGTVVDVTDNKRIEQALRDSAARIRAIVDHVVDGIITIDTLGHIQSFNVAAERIFGYTADEVRDRNISMLMPEPYHSRHDAYLANYVCGGAAKVIGSGREVTGRRKNGSTFPLDLAVSEVWTAGQQIFTGIVRDISERKYAEEQLVAAKDAAERASRAKSEFLSSMSHELRTPLNAVIGFAQLLEGNPGAPLSNDQAEYVDNILKGGWHLLDLINEVLDLARLDAGRLQVSMEEVALSSSVYECLMLVQPAAEKRGIRIVNRITKGDGIGVWADAIRLKQILLNLLSNAVKYNREGGTVTLDVDHTTTERVRIAVRDTGRGFTDEQLSRLFQPFERLGAESGTIDGVGIGLVISKRLVALMGGTLVVTSTHGAGSTFSFDLASAPDDGNDAAIESIAQAGPAVELPVSDVTHAVLYVEDNPANLKLVSSLLKRRPQVKLVSAPNGELGLELAQTHHFDLILLDINLPGLNGVEIKTQLDANAATRDIPVIAISANAMPRDVERGKAAGFARYISKPVNVQMLLSAIDELLAPSTAT